jgi:hypothetical protein
MSGAEPFIAAAAVLASIGGTAATLATLPDAPKVDDVLAPVEEDPGEARRQQKLRASARLGSQRTVLAGGEAPVRSTVGTPTLLGG